MLLIDTKIVSNIVVVYTRKWSWEQDTVNIALNSSYLLLFLVKLYKLNILSQYKLYNIGGQVLT